MDYKQRAEEAKKGMALLKQGVFPNELLENIKEIRLRKNLSDDIFYSKEALKLDELTDLERKVRASRLKVELAFIKFMAAIAGVRKVAPVLLLIGLLQVVFHTAKDNGNLSHGIISIIEGATLVALAFNNKILIRHYKVILFSFVAALAAELIVFGVPNPILSSVDNDILAGRRGAVSKIINIASPYLYIICKVLVIGGIAWLYSAHQSFIQEKSNFEK